MKLEEYLAGKKEIVLGFLGGSITEGAGASSEERNFCSLVTQWLTKQYPENSFQMVNAGVGGTDSSLGAYRVERDLLVHQPDVVFVEFATNDTDMSYDRGCATMEGIVRKILRRNKETRIVFIYTLTRRLIERYYARGMAPVSVRAHQRIADAYHIPSLNMGRLLYDRMLQEHARVEEYLPDTSHPNDAGYAFYAEKIIEFLLQMSWEAIPFPKEPVIPGNLEFARLVLAEKYEGENWTLVRQTMHGRLPSYVESNIFQAELVIPFEGTEIGIYWCMDKDSGKIGYHVDSCEEKKASGWDHYCVNFNRANSLMLVSGLEYGKHELHIRVLDEKDEASEGYYVRIGAFLIS